MSRQQGTTGTLHPAAPPRMQRFMVNPFVTVIHYGADEILVKHGSRSRQSRVIRDAAKTGLLGGVLRAIAFSPASVDDLVGRGVLEPAQAETGRACVDELVRQGIVIPEDENPSSSYMRLLFPGGDQEIVSTRDVAIVGSGSLSMLVACYVASLQPRSLHLLSDVGDDVPDVRSHPDALVHFADGTPDDVAEIERAFDGRDLVVAPLGRYSPWLLHTLNETALRTGVPWIAGYMDGSMGVVGPHCVPGRTPCYSEFEMQFESTISMAREHIVYKEHVLNGAAGTQTFGPHIGAVAGWMASAVLPALVTGRSPVTGRAVVLDFERLMIDQVEVLKAPRCPACGVLRSPYRHPFL